MKPAVFVLLLVLSGAAGARMYQWVDPQSGATQLSGKPPMWYRSGKEGPRVFVFERNRVIDDTGIDVSDRERNRLRQQALLQADRDPQAARRRLLEAKRLDAALARKQEERSTEEDKALPVMEEAATEEPEADRAPPEAVSDIEKMRKIIEDWEKAETEKAREMLQRAQDLSQELAP